MGQFFRPDWADVFSGVWDQFGSKWGKLGLLGAYFAGFGALEVYGRAGRADSRALKGRAARPSSRGRGRAKARVWQNLTILPDWCKIPVLASR